jgi:hypothetical protein
MYIFLIIFLMLNFFAAVGYSDILRLNSDRLLRNYVLGTYILIFVVFFSCLSIMKQWIIGVLIYEVIGFILYIFQCKAYTKKNFKF